MKALKSSTILTYTTTYSIEIEIYNNPTGFNNQTRCEEMQNFKIYVLDGIMKVLGHAVVY